MMELRSFISAAGTDSEAWVECFVYALNIQSTPPNLYILAVLSPYNYGSFNTNPSPKTLIYSPKEAGDIIL